jgi:alpha-2-macroglobulin
MNPSGIDRILHRATGLFVLVLILVVVRSSVAEQPKPALAQRPAAAGTVIVPDHFLRRWDPVTIFFEHDAGPAVGGPEDHPEKVVSMLPGHPGAFVWLDARTLQFRPAEPWPPLARFDWKIGDSSVLLTTLMATPVATIPADRTTELDSVTAITLTFPEPIDTDALAQMVRIELRPLPGVESGQERWLGREDFQVKAMERRERSDQATYVLDLASSVPLGTRAIVHLRLSLDDGFEESFARFGFATVAPFRVVGVGCRNPGGRRAQSTYPVTPEGSRYGRDQALTCGAQDRTVLVEFSSAPRAVGPLEGRSLVRLTPPVDDLSYRMEGKVLAIGGKFATETLYRVVLTPAPISDLKNRILDLHGESEMYLYFPSLPAYLKWGAAQGVVERLGPKMVPVEGRGDERLDLRIHPVDPLDRSFWPFPEQPVSIDESKRPPGPGEQPTPFAEPNRAIVTAELAAQISALGSPLVSEIVRLPLRREGSAATFGVDLAPYLTRITGSDRPGTYLVGLRRLDSSTERSWLRVQVTDLTLSSVEEPRAVRFVVTSLSTGQPVPKATVRIEGTRTENARVAWETVAEGNTAPDGSFTWNAPGDHPRVYYYVRRIVVRKGDDVLVLDPSRAPNVYADNAWSPTRETWLQWAFAPLSGRGPQPETLCHIFTERPVYRPEDVVHIKGYLRWRDKGRLWPENWDAFVVVEGPANQPTEETDSEKDAAPSASADQVWKYPVALTPEGSFYYAFSEKNLPTGKFTAHLENKQGYRCGKVAFRMEAYRIPTFEVQLHTADEVPLDREFEVKLTSSYYAGGKVAERPVQWRVTQFPYTWIHKKEAGFFYSSDARFSGGAKFESSPRLDKQDTTGEDGSSSLVLNPAIEPTAQPRTYVIEATVTGADDQTVTATRRVQALPPFVLGLKAPRFLERATRIEPSILAIGPDGKPLSGVEVTVRLLNRQWHSHLTVSDFSSGTAKYVTDVVDEKVYETKISTGDEPVTVMLPIEQAGVYVVELEAHDRLKRAQTVSVDLYAGGEEPVTWPKPTSTTFEVVSDRDTYDPSSTAAIVLKSPFQNGRALAVIEAPDGNKYEWLEVKGGSATYRVPIDKTYVPRVPVHFVLLRGRVEGTAPVAGTRTDLGKPATVAATAWLKVNPIENRVEVALEHPQKAKPRDQVPVTIRLSDPHGKPLAGEVTLWLVDQAVLALGKEQPLDPVPDFLSEVHSHLTVRDTRNLSFGYLPFLESPGGDGLEEGGLFERTTVRRTFKPVPYYNPAIQVGPDGVVTVMVELFDDLTNFKLRAKAISGPDRFGYATGELAVRLPVIVQPALPRFVRPGDSFTAAAITRVVEGEGGAGTAEVQVAGVTMEGAAKRSVAWEGERPERIEFPVQVVTPPYDAEGRLAYDAVTFRVAVERTADRTGDAFEVKLPVRDDRERVAMRSLQDLAPGAVLPIPELAEPVRAGSVRRSVLVSDQPALVRMAAGLSFLLEYPYDCTEQRLSLARAHIALRKFREVLQQEGSDERLQKAVRDVLDWIPLTLDSHDLVAYWPGSRGYVSLTAWAVQFMVEARTAGLPVDGKLFDKLVRSLDAALRSDYSNFIDGASFAERAWALSALAAAEKSNPGYAAELARRSRYLDLEGVSEVLYSLSRGGDTSSSTVDSLVQELWDGVIIRLYQGRELYGGLQAERQCRSGLILPSETRTVAEITRAVARVRGNEPRLQVLVNALVSLGRGDGWGSTNANAAALVALSEILQPPFAGSMPRTVLVRIGEDRQAVSLGPQAPLGHVVSTNGAGGEITLVEEGGSGPVVVRAETSYVPDADGSLVKAHSSGFVVARELLRVSVAPETLAERIPLEEAGKNVAFAIGDVIEDHVQVVNPDDRNYAAIVVPLAAGVEPLNPNLATAPSEAKPTGALTRPPSYVAFLDDRVAFYYDELPKGTYDFYFRARATTAGRFIQPAASAEMMYDGAVRGNSTGAKLEIGRVPD